jgi:hypothetical protein
MWYGLFSAALAFGSGLFYSLFFDSAKDHAGLSETDSAAETGNPTLAKANQE